MPLAKASHMAKLRIKMHRNKLSFQSEKLKNFKAKDTYTDIMKNWGNLYNQSTTLPPKGKLLKSKEIFLISPAPKVLKDSEQVLNKC